MAEYRTAEQYVVAELETTKLILEQERDNHERDVLELTEELKKTKSILADAQKLIDFIGSKFIISESACSGPYIYMDTIYAAYDKEDFERVVHEFGIALLNKKEETENE